MLEEMGHEVEIDPSKNNALEKLENGDYDVGMIDPVPLPSAKPMAMQLRWKQRASYLYLFVLTHDPENTEIIRSGLNDYMDKSFQEQDVVTKLEHAELLVNFYKRLNTEPDFRTQGVVFGKRPFSQLLLSALDRTYRYSEQGFLLFLEMDNYNQISESLGIDKMNTLTQDFAEYVSKLRRMSDFLARTDSHQFVLLMQRPEAESEPVDAAERFIVAMKEFKSDIARPSFRVRLVELPMASILMDAKIDENGQEKRLK